MSSLTQRFHEYWAAREPRERVLLAGCAALLGLALLYALWAPLAREQQRQQRRLPQLEQEARRIEALAGRWKGLGATSRGVADWRSASQARLVTLSLPSNQARLLGQDQDAQRWQFDNVPFNTLLDWLGGLYADAGVRVRSAKLTAAGPGNVSATLELYHP